MRTGRRYLSVPQVGFGCLILLVLLSPGILLAGAPGFSLDNSYERESEFINSDWNIQKTYSQDYTLDWSHKFSDRLDVNLEFDLTVEDIFKSKDVDTKEIIPTIELDMSGVVWDIGFTAQDTIEYTNEFNKERKDAIELSTELNLVPFFMPTFDATFQKLINDQENLEDTDEEKLDFISTYKFGEILNLDASYKKEKLDDKLIDNSDKDLEKWDFTASLNQPMTPALKFNLDTTFQGETEDTLNNAGVVVSTDRSRSIENRARIALDAWPAVSSDLEITDEKEFEDDTDTTNVSFNFEISQELLTIGTLTETFDYDRERVKSPIPADDVRELDISLDFEFAGNPTDYVDYSVKQSFEFGDDDFEDDTKDTDLRKREFDLSLTVTPFESLSLDTAVNRSAEYTIGVLSSETRSYKIELTYEGEALHFPNLAFNPSVEFTTEDDRVDNEVTDTQTIDLQFTYTFSLPKAFIVTLEPNYTIERTDGSTDTIELGMAYEVSMTLEHADWELAIENNGEYTVNFGEENDFDNDFDVRVSMGLFGNMRFDLEYQYQYSRDSEDEDTLEAALDMDFNKYTFNISYENDRTFVAEKDVLRTFAAEFTMDF